MIRFLLRTYDSVGEALLFKSVWFFLEAQGVYCMYRLVLVVYDPPEWWCVVLSVWFGSVRFGLVRFGGFVPIRFGPVRFVFDCIRFASPGLESRYSRGDFFLAVCLSS